jgi:phage tail-like protein
MSSIFSDGALHPGHDANDAWWITVRRPEEWGADPRPPGEYGTRYDASRMVLELSPHALAPGMLPPASVTDSDGTEYTVDPYGDRILRKRSCDTERSPLPGVGGHGWSTGRFDNPCAIAIADGWLYVVDRGNHRVQVIDPAAPDGARVVIVLGGADAWGRPCAGDAGGALRDPVAIAVGPHRIYVAMKSGWIQPYDRQFRPGRKFAANRPGAGMPDIVALATAGDDLVIVADAAWSRLVRFDCRGTFVDEMGTDQAPPEMAAELALARFELEGTRVVGPIDGGVERLAWHQIVVDAELPEGTSIEVQTWAADGIALPPGASIASMETPPALPASPPWAPGDPVPMPIAGIESNEGELRRPVLSDTSAWERWRAAPYRRGASWSFDLDGNGPNAAASFSVPAEIARRLRVDDELQFDVSPAVKPERTIASISPRVCSLVATGDRSPAYTAGTQLILHERDGRALDPVVIHKLTAGEKIDLTPITNDGDGADIALPHSIAALLYRGDVVELVKGTKRVQLEIETFETTPAAITLSAPVPVDCREAVVRLVDAAGRMVVDKADGWGHGLPSGSVINVERIDGSGALVSDPRTVVWSDPAVATVWTTTPPDPTWISFSPATPAAATDRGRYLWVKLRLRGARRHASDMAATATPVVRSLRLVAPRLSFLSYLPAVYSRRDDNDPTGSLFLERFLALFEGRLTAIEGRYEAVAYLLNPVAADDEWLDFVAGWFDLVLDPTWPRARRAALLAQIFELYRIRGTPEGIVRFVEAYTGHRPELIEGFAVRPRVGLILGCEGILGCAPLGGLDVAAAAREELLAAYAHRFTLVAYVDSDCELAAAETSLRALVDAVKPAHTDVDLRIAVPHGRVGIETTVGLDFILGDDRTSAAPLGTAGTNGQLAPVLGVDAVLGSSLGAGALAENAPPSIGSFSIR